MPLAGFFPNHLGLKRPPQGIGDRICDSCARPSGDPAHSHMLSEQCLSRVELLCKILRSYDSLALDNAHCRLRFREMGGLECLRLRPSQVSDCTRTERFLVRAERIKRLAPLCAGDALEKVVL